MYYHPFAGIRCKTQTSTTKKGITMDNEQLKRIADAIEEILRLVKLDQEKMAKRFPDEDKE
jgi:ABC-type proline/glycine betaine transport system ATPase subunit